MDDYKDIRELLRPRHDIKASLKLRHNVRVALDSDRKKRSARKWILGGISISTVAAILTLVFIPGGMSANEILSDVIAGLRRSDNIEMVVEVRTRPLENFRYIDLTEDFVRHNISISSSDSTLSWWIDKGGRAAMGHDGDLRMWIPLLRLGWHFSDHETSDILGYMANLLTPGKILETELEQCLNDRNAQYSMSKSGNDILLTVNASAQGDFNNPYLLNTSIAESENIRRYVIDAETKELKSASVSIISEKKEITVLRIVSIDYDSGAHASFGLPSDIHFIENETLSGLSGLTAEEAASTILTAFSDWNTEILDKAISPAVSLAIYREKFLGATLLSVGQAFNSGSNHSTFVPYTIKLKDGTVQRHNIALQRSASYGWTVVGGL